MCNAKICFLYFTSCVLFLNTRTMDLQYQFVYNTVHFVGPVGDHRSSAKSILITVSYFFITSLGNFFCCVGIQNASIQLDTSPVCGLIWYSVTVDPSHKGTIRHSFKSCHILIIVKRRGPGVGRALEMLRLPWTYLETMKHLQSVLSPEKKRKKVCP